MSARSLIKEEAPNKGAPASDEVDLMDIVRVRASREAAGDARNDMLDVKERTVWERDVAETGAIREQAGLEIVEGRVVCADSDNQKKDFQSKKKGVSQPKTTQQQKQAANTHHVAKDQDFQAENESGGQEDVEGIDVEAGQSSLNPPQQPPSFSSHSQVPPKQPSEAGAWAFSTGPAGEGTNRRESVTSSAAGIHSGNSDITISSITSLVGLQRAGSESGLSVATLVDESEQDFNNIPRASQADANSRAKAREDTRLFRTRVFLGISVLTVLILVAVLVPVLLTSKEDKDREEIFSAQTTTTPVPTYVSFEDKVLSLLPEETASVIMTDPASPQSRAFQWILEDQYHNEYPTTDHLLQRYLLATLYFATSGEAWLANEGWLNHTINECEWYNKHNFGMNEELSERIPGYIDEFEQPPASERCDEEGLYSHLWLDANGLLGSIPEELYLMTSLETFGIGFNRIQGTISTQVGQMTNLIGLFIPYAELTGSVPSEVGLLTSLQVGNFYWNQEMSGQVPDTIWSFPNMTSWAIISGMPRMEAHTIPTEVGLMTNMRWFVDVVSNAHGETPTEFGLMTSLTHLYLDRTDLSGIIPPELCTNAPDLSEIQVNCSGVGCPCEGACKCCENPDVRCA